MRKILLLLLITFISSLSFAQTYYLCGSSAYDCSSTSADIGYKVVFDKDYNIYTIGWGSCLPTGWDILLVKYTCLSSSPFINQLCNGKSGQVYVLKPEAGGTDGNYIYVVGYIGQAAQSNNIITVKFNPSCGTEWVKIYDGAFHGGDRGYGIDVDASGYVYVTGRTDIGGQQKVIILKYTPSGDTVWTRTYTGAESRAFDQAQAVRVDNQGNIFVSGSSGASQSNTDYLTLAYDNNGNFLWAKRYSGSGNSDDKVVNMAIDNAGNVFVTGYFTKTGPTIDIATLKYQASNGNLLDSAFYGGIATTDQPTAMVLRNNYLYVIGFTDVGLKQFVTIKYDLNLDAIWTKTYGHATTNCIPYSVFVNATTENIYVSGEGKAPAGTGTDADFLTLKYSPGGALTIFPPFSVDAGKDDKAYSIIASPNDTNFYVTGYSVHGSNDTTLYTVRYSVNQNCGNCTALPGIKKISGEIPVIYSLYQNYPNPFNPSTSIRFDIPVQSFVKITVYDVLGKEITILVNEKLDAGIYKAEWNTAGSIDYPSGIYLCKIEAASITGSNNFSQTRKMVLLK